ncbi:membrane protein [Candidatus Magnetoovum chiemensis]|nr:membrane protein [Candidatus Magnetoovum chiemensis]
MTNKKNSALFKQIAMISQVVIHLVISILVGIIIGIILDRLFGTSPILTIIFSFIGLAAGFMETYLIAGKMLNKND